MDGWMGMRRREERERAGFCWCGDVDGMYAWLVGCLVGCLVVGRKISEAMVDG